MTNFSKLPHFIFLKYGHSVVKCVKCILQKMARLVHVIGNDTFWSILCLVRTLPELYDIIDNVEEAGEMASSLLLLMSVVLKRPHPYVT